MNDQDLIQLRGATRRFFRDLPDEARDVLVDIGLREGKAGYQALADLIAGAVRRYQDETMREAVRRTTRAGRR